MRTQLVDAYKFGIGKRILRIPVDHFLIGVSRSSVDKVIDFFDVFTMVPFPTPQPKKAFFQNRVLAIPKRQTKAPAHGVVAETLEAVLSPTIGAAVRMLEREECPSFPVAAVVFANGPPLALCQIRTPSPPPRAGCDLAEPSAFGSVEESMESMGSHCFSCSR